MKGLHVDSPPESCHSHFLQRGRGSGFSAGAVVGMVGRIEMEVGVNWVEIS